MIDIIEKAHKGNIRAAIAVPCQHGKTTVIMHAIPWLLLRHPRITIFYATYGQQFSGSNSREMRTIASGSGVTLSKDHNTIQQWKTTEGGGVFATSVDGPGTGVPAHIIFIDDPYKNREEAENPENRALVESWMRGVIRPRLAPGGSIYIVASRWHAEDLSGTFIAKMGYKEVRLAAINDDGADETRELGAALCPWGPDPEYPRTLEFLEEVRRDIDDYDFESLYQGRPRPRAGAIFRDATLYDALPEGGYSEVLGFDLAHSAGPRADWTVIVRIRRYMIDGLAYYYVTDVKRWRTSTADSEAPIRAAMAENPNAPLAWYISGLEKGSVQQFGMLKPPIRIIGLPAWSSKYVRAQPTSKLWNAGRILIPRGTLPDGTIVHPWVSPMLSEVCGFTGDDSNKDDQIDGLVAGIDYFEATSGRKSKHPVTFGQRRC